MNCRNLHSQVRVILVIIHSMGKRARDEPVADEDRSSKRWRPSAPDHLSSLSDELVLKVFSYLPVPQLVICQR